MVDAIGRGYVVEYCITSFQKRREQLIFRSYISDALYCLNNAFAARFGGSELQTRFIDIVKPSLNEQDERSGDEIAEDIILRAGLSFGGKKMEEPSYG